MTPTRRKIHRTAVAIGLLAALGGCASLPPPTSELGTVEATISVAATPDGQRYAAADLEKARAELRSAQAAMAKQDYEQARAWAAMAQADADLARAKGRASGARNAVAVKTRENEDLRHRLLDQEPLQ